MRFATSTLDKLNHEIMRQKEYATQMTCLFGDLKHKYEVLLVVIVYNKKNAIISEGRQQGQLRLAIVGEERGKGKRSNTWSPCGG